LIILRFYSVPCIRLSSVSWPSRQLLSARKSTISYRSISLCPIVPYTFHFHTISFIPPINSIRHPSYNSETAFERSKLSSPMGAGGTRPLKGILCQFNSIVWHTYGWYCILCTVHENLDCCPRTQYAAYATQTNVVKNYMTMLQVCQQY